MKKQHKKPETTKDNLEVDVIKAFLESKRFRDMIDGTATGEFLRNRIENAFRIGLDAGSQISQKRLVAAIERIVQQLLDG